MGTQLEHFLTGKKNFLPVFLAVLLLGYVSGIATTDIVYGNIDTGSGFMLCAIMVTVACCLNIIESPAEKAWKKSGSSNSPVGRGDLKGSVRYNFSKSIENPNRPPDGPRKPEIPPKGPENPDIPKPSPQTPGKPGKGPENPNRRPPGPADPNNPGGLKA